MNKLEQAARLSMGGFHDIEASSALPRSRHPLRSWVLMLAAIALAAAICQFI